MADTEKLIASLAHDIAPVKASLHPFVLGAIWLGGAAVYIVLILMVFDARSDWLLKLETPLFLAEIVLLAGIIVVTCLSAALLSFPDMHQKRRLAFAPVLMGLLFLLVLCMAWFADDPASPPPAHSVECTVSIAMLALLPAIWMFYTMRGFASTHPYYAGCVALLAAFSIGALSLRLNEQTDSIMHVIQWHYLPMIGVAIAGLWLGRRILKW